MSLVLKTDPGTFHPSGPSVSIVRLEDMNLYDSSLFSAVNCTDPPVKADAGTWEWNGRFNYGTSVLYTCGPYGNFLDSNGFLYEELISTCSWDRTWSPPVLDPCAATSCQTIPFPPKKTGLVHLPDPNNPITLASEFTLYDVSLPLKMKIPEDLCGDEGQIMLIVGRIPSESKTPMEIAFLGLESPKEAFHVLVDPVQEFIQRWTVTEENPVDVAGEPGDGTTIDLDEPFLLRLEKLSIFGFFLQDRLRCGRVDDYSQQGANLPSLLPCNESDRDLSG